MAKPPASPPSSDIGGVHQDGTRPSKPLDTHGEDGGEDLARAAREDAARPDHSDEEADDDRTS